MSMHSFWHTWAPEVVYFLWFSFVLSLLGNVSFPIMGTKTLFLLRNACSLYWSKIRVPWLCLKHNYCARNSKAVFRTVDRGRDLSHVKGIVRHLNIKRSAHITYIHICIAILVRTDTDMALGFFCNLCLKKWILYLWGQSKCPYQAKNVWIYPFEVPIRL